MEIQWFTRNNHGVATIYETNITLNTVAANHFKSAYTTLIGFDEAKKILVVKAISKDEQAMGLYSEDETHPISIKPSYGRINGKNIIRNLISIFPLDFSIKPFHKFPCEWDQTEKMLKIHLEREVTQ
ncbi:MAG: hypothetical protein PHY42_01080 [Bacilli bacterium]|jgi:hypothetical protein|nr:hypothetical protein [Bacilli bacterium]